MPTSIKMYRSAINELNDAQILDLCRGANSVKFYTEMPLLSMPTADDTKVEGEPVKAGQYHPDQLLTVPQLAELMGVKVSTIYTWRSKCRDKLPPHVDIGSDRRSTLRYRYSDVVAFLSRK